MVAGVVDGGLAAQRLFKRHGASRALVAWRKLSGVTYPPGMPTKFAAIYARNYLETGAKFLLRQVN